MKNEIVKNTITVRTRSYEDHTFQISSNGLCYPVLNILKYITHYVVFILSIAIVVN